MNKINFKVKGMNCNACALSITKELKNQPGVVEAKVDFDSKSGFAMYDKTKIQKQGILNAIEKAGDYQAEEANDSDNQAGGGEAQEATTSRNQFLTGFLAGGGVVLLLLIMFFNITPKQSSLRAQINPSANNVLPEKQKPAQQPSVYEAQTTQTFTIAKDDHIRGNPNASITLVEFSDFQCPFCESQYQTLKQLLDEYPQKIRLVYRHFPLGFHQFAQKAAEASECADEQGKFWEYHDKLFQNQNDYNVANFKKWAAGLSLKTEQFNSCLDSGKYTSKVQADAQEGAQKGVNGTPATFINGQLISGALPYATFKEAIDSLL
ncbi:MAG: thioredoxin domain-containing protein [Patescibacteria group bacterium]